MAGVGVPKRNGASKVVGKPGLLHPMQHVRVFMRSCSLKTAFVVYAIIATIVALVVSVLASSYLANSASTLWSESHMRSGMYIYLAESEKLVPAESLSWYREDGKPLYVEVSPSDSAEPVSVRGAGEGGENPVVYDGRILTDNDMAAGATEDPIALSDVPEYDARQKGREKESAASMWLPPNEYGETPATSTVAYYVVFRPQGATYDVLQLLSIFVFPLVFALVFIVAARLFYRNHMGGSIALMNDAANRIAENDLDFHLESDSGNELGRLVVSFEDMRASLLANSRELWRVMEARREANAAFAHDLRTPLTVLKGQLEMLVSFTASGALSADQIEAMARASQRQAERIERYVENMRDLAWLDDCEIEAVDVDVSELAARLAESARALAAECGKRADTVANGLPATVRVDPNVVERCVGNLLANAARYARSSIVLTIEIEGACLAAIVEDDGPGFSDEALRHGLEPYFRDTSRDDSSEHFGLGLGICAALSAKCDGSVSLSNRPSGEGARVEIRFPSVSSR